MATQRKRLDTARKPGEPSTNPSGKGGNYHDTMALARSAAPWEWIGLLSGLVETLAALIPALTTQP